MKSHFGALLIAFFTLSFANAQVKCNAAKTECSVSGMPLLNQYENSVKARYGNVACVPTATAMVLEGIFAARNDTVPNSLTDRAYKQSPYPEIILLGEAFRIGPRGTGDANERAAYASLAAGFKRKTSFIYYTTAQKEITVNGLHEGMKSNTASMLIQGNYKYSCTKLASGRKACSFTRDGGHGTAVKTTAVNNKIFIYDPQNYTYWTSLGRLSEDESFKGATLALPSLFNGNRARLMRKNNTYAFLVENHFGLR